MCDYSLGGLPNRLAVEGEQLTVHKFRTGSFGLASPADLPCRAPTSGASFWQRCMGLLEQIWYSSPDVDAVCIPPGARLILKDIPRNLQDQLDLQEEERVVFVQTSASAYAYRDAIEFRNGCHLMLQKLKEGMRVTVITLGGGNGAQEDVSIPSELVSY